LKNYEKFLNIFESKYPIQQAGMGEVARFPLAKSVYLAGALGTLGYSPLHYPNLEYLISNFPKELEKKIGINFLMPFLFERHMVKEIAKRSNLLNFFTEIRIQIWSSLFIQAMPWLAGRLEALKN